MDGVLSDVAFLARSPNRVSVLRALAEGPRSRAALRERTGASRATLGRVLGEFEDRYWVARSGRDYHITALGTLVVADFEPLLETMEAVGNLREVARWLPIDEFDFDLRSLADAAVVRPETTNPAVHIERQEAVFATATRVRGLATSTVTRHLQQLAFGVKTGDLTVDCVLSPRCLAHVRDDETRAALFEAIVDAGGTVSVTDEPIPTTMFLVDDTALIWVCADNVPVGLLESGDGEVLTWVHRQFEAYRETATPVQEGQLTVA